MYYRNSYGEERLARRHKRCVYGRTINTWYAGYIGDGFETEAGTNGHQGAEGRTFFCIHSMDDSLGLHVKATEDGVSVALCGDDGLDAIMEALRRIISILEVQQSMEDV